MNAASLKVLFLVGLMFFFTACAPTDQDVALSSFSISEGTLFPAFNPDITEYTTDVGPTIQTLFITVSTPSEDQSVLINGSLTRSLAAMKINSGETNVTIVVTDSKSSSKTYTLLVRKPIASDNAHLLSLSLSSGSLSPSFDRNISNYTVTVPFSVLALQISPLPENTGATIEVNGDYLRDGVPANIGLIIGTTNTTFTVAAQDGSRIRIYTLSIVREVASSDNSLASLTINPGLLAPSFSSSTLTYLSAISDSAAEITVNVFANHIGATVEVSWNGSQFEFVNSGQTISGLIPLSGVNLLEVRITSETGATQVYSVTVFQGPCALGYYENSVHACIPDGQ